MPFRDMYRELEGWVAGLPFGLSRTLINRALEKIYEANNWSFQIQESGWFTPGLIAPTGTGVSAGTITATLGSTTITGNATAKATWNAIPAPFLITQMQIRLPAYALYDVVAYDSGTGVINIDRPWSEPAGVSLQYMLYQTYFTAPVPDFKRWLAVRDFTNAANLIWWEWRQKDLDMFDPQRTVFQNPDHVVPYKVDTRENTSTPGSMRFELYPQPLSQLPYSLYFVRKGPQLVNPGDTLPYPLTEKLVTSRARMLAYEFQEAQKGTDVQRGAGSDFKFLYQAAEAEYDGGEHARAGPHQGGYLLDAKKVDRDIYDQSISKLRRYIPAIGAPYYSAVTGEASVGVF